MNSLASLISTIPSAVVATVLPNPQEAPQSGENPPASGTGSPGLQTVLSHLQGVMGNLDGIWNELSGNASLDGTPPPVISNASPPAVFQEVFGQDSQEVRALIDNRSDVNVNELVPLAQEPGTLTALCQLLTSRPDIHFDDLVSKGANGQLQLSSALTDPPSHALLMQRDDVTPADLTQLQQALQEDMDPDAAQQSYEQAVHLMLQRSDVGPRGLTDMLGNLDDAVTDTQEGQRPALRDEAMADMFSRSLTLLSARPDVNLGDVNSLISQTSSQFGGMQDIGGLQELQTAYDKATHALTTNGDLSVNDVTADMKTLGNEFGDDHEDKLTAFQDAV